MHRSDANQLLKTKSVAENVAALYRAALVAGLDREAGRESCEVFYRQWRTML
jgi:hypothetical protein